MDTLSDIPYEKGSVFLWYLEELVGGLTKMKKFLRHFLAKHFLRTLYSEDFKSTFLDYFKDTKGLNDIDWDTWFYGTGMPKEKVMLSKIWTNIFGFLLSQGMMRHILSKLLVLQSLGLNGMEKEVSLLQMNMKTFHFNKKMSSFIHYLWQIL